MRSWLSTSLLIVLRAIAIPVQASASVEIPFQFHDGFIWLQVSVRSNANQMNFLLDSGASASVIDLRAARRLDVKLGKRARVIGVNSMTDGYWPQKLAIELGGLSLRRNFLAVDLTKLGMACSTQIDGLIGIDFFDGKAVQIDFISQKIRLLDAQEAKQCEGEALPLEMRSCGMCIPVAVNAGKPQRTRLDTGCASALHWVTSSIDPQNCTRRIAVGITEFSLPSTLTSVSLGSRTFKNVPTDVYADAIFPGEAGLLGNGLLARFARVTIDARAGRVLFSHESNPSVSLR